MGEFLFNLDVVIDFLTRNPNPDTVKHMTLKSHHIIITF